MAHLKDNTNKRFWGKLERKKPLEIVGCATKYDATTNE